MNLYNYFVNANNIVHQHRNSDDKIKLYIKLNNLLHTLKS